MKLVEGEKGGGRSMVARELSTKSREEETRRARPSEITPGWVKGCGSRSMLSRNWDRGRAIPSPR